jgi:hypothetical protein
VNVIPSTSSGEHVPNAVSDNDGGFDGRAEPSRRGNEQVEIGFFTRQTPSRVMTTVRFASLPSSSRLYFALIIRSRVATAKGI